jgi:hypothetical protein
MHHLHNPSFWHSAIIALIFLVFAIFAGRSGGFGGGSPPSASAETGRRLLRILKARQN